MKPRTKVIGGGVAGGAMAIIAGVIAVEGWFSNDKDDPGGATTYGITERVARAHGYTGLMRDLPKDTAQRIYIEDYIVKPGYDRMLELSPAVAHKLIDGGVNVGPGRETKWLQLSLNALSRGGADYPTITVDGGVGPATVAAYRGLAAKRGPIKACELTIKLLDGWQTMHYASLGMDKYMVGWIDHRIENVPLADCAKATAP